MKIEGKNYKVVENLGYCHSAGCYAKVVLDENGKERVVVKTGKTWAFGNNTTMVAFPTGKIIGQAL